MLQVSSGSREPATQHPDFFLKRRCPSLWGKSYAHMCAHRENQTLVEEEGNNSWGPKPNSDQNCEYEPLDHQNKFRIVLVNKHGNLKSDPGESRVKSGFRAMSSQWDKVSAGVRPSVVCGMNNLAGVPQPQSPPHYVKCTNGILTCFER